MNYKIVNNNTGATYFLNEKERLYEQRPKTTY